MVKFLSQEQNFVTFLIIQVVPKKNSEQIRQNLRLSVTVNSHFALFPAASNALYSTLVGTNWKTSPLLYWFSTFVTPTLSLKVGSIQETFLGLSEI